MNKRFLGIIAIFVVAIALIGIVSAFQANDSKRPFLHYGIKSQLNQAVQEGNFEDWTRIIKENDFSRKGFLLSVITKENFSKLKALHTAILNRDFENAKQIKNDLGIKNYGKKQFRNHSKKQFRNFRGYGQYKNGGVCNYNKTKGGQLSATL